MNKQISFSIIIPVYNAESYISKCLDSVLRQTHKNFEVLCINDGSTDNSLKILQDYSEKNKCIRLFSIENSGPSAARNMGLKYATGDYVLFLDSDDFLSKNALSILSSKIDNNNAPDVMVFGAKIISKDTIDTIPDWVIESTTSKDESFDGEAYKLLPTQKNLVPFIWNKSFKRVFLLDNNIAFNNEIKLGEDKLFLYDVFIRAKKLLFISNQLYNYRWQRENSIMTTFKNNKLKTTENHLKMILAVLKSLKANNALEYRVDDTLQWMVALLYHSSFKDLSYEEAVPVATIFEHFYTLNKIDTLLNFNWWDNSNLTALNSILGFAHNESEKYDISIIMHENESKDYNSIVRSYLKQEKVKVEVIIICFSINFYTFIKNKYAEACKVFLFPGESFSFANNFGLKIANGKYITFASYDSPLKTNLSLFDICSHFELNNNSIACIADASSTRSLIEHFDDPLSLSKYASAISNIVFNKQLIQTRSIKFNFAGGFEESAFVCNALLGQMITICNTSLQKSYTFFDDFLGDKIINSSEPLENRLRFVFAISKSIINNKCFKLANYILEYFNSIDWEINVANRQFILLYPILKFTNSNYDYNQFLLKMSSLISTCEEYDSMIQKEINNEQQLLNRINHSKTMELTKRIRNSFVAKIYRRIKK